MINISNNLVKELRKRTSIGIVECKQALIKANGDIELAIDIIRKSGLQAVAKKSQRATPSGLIAVEIASNKQYGVMIEINCETDFVAKDNAFQEFAKTVIMKALNNKIGDVCTLQDEFLEKSANLIAKFGENISIRRLVVLTGDFLGYYIHTSKIGVMVTAVGQITVELIKHIAMHIAARNPKYITVGDIPEDIIMREYNIQMNIAMKSSNSEKILKKITEGRMNKFMNEIVLTKQNFIMDVNKTVEQFLTEHCVKITNFARFELGEDI